MKFLWLTAGSLEAFVKGQRRIIPQMTDRHRGMIARLTGREVPPGVRPVGSAACAFEGTVLEVCTACGANESRHVRECDVHGKCTRGVVSGRVRACASCRDYTPELPPWSDHSRPREFDHLNLYPRLPGRRFNPGLVKWGSEYAFCWRDGWRGSNLWACRLTPALCPDGPPVRLELAHPEANYGREDPQLFTFRGRLHVAFVGVVGGGRGATRTAVLYARLSDDFRMEAIFAPRFPGMDPRRWEKNWSWFESGGELHAVYSISPHRVLRVSGSHAEFVAESESFPWEGGEPRGGASPVLIGNEFWSFFHDSVHPPGGGKKVYRVGLYCFESEPPFRPIRYRPRPVAEADREAENDNYCHVLFPRGASPCGPEWLLSCGVHDRRSRIISISHNDLENSLVDLPAASTGPSPPSVVATAFLNRASDPYNGGHKIGSDSPVWALPDAKKSDYLAPFVKSASRFGFDAAVIHDGLPARVLSLAGGGLRFHQMHGPGPDTAFERRWFLLKKWLRSARPERVWFVDCNDVAFVAHPFSWMERWVGPGQVAALREGKPYRSGGQWNPWYAGQWDRLPPEYAEEVQSLHADEYPLSCGAWGGTRAAVTPILEELCGRITDLKGYAGVRTGTPAVLDMVAFQATLFGRASQVVPFNADGVTPLNGVPSPLVHDRRLAESLFPQEAGGGVT